MTASPPASPRKSSRHDQLRPPTWRSGLVIVSVTLALCVYLFVDAPQPLAARGTASGTIPMRAVFSLLELENDAARALWTEDIVHHGKAVGLAFGEAWHDDGVHEGPLPALFLRETARNLERSSLQLGLFLGSRYPINTANQLTGLQASYLASLEANGAPQFFFEPETARHTAMFADRAITQACVQCHNEHHDSPKRDWQLGAIMGATTWMYPADAVTAERALELIATLRASIRSAYAAYLTKVASFPRPPLIGARWPREGYALPSVDVFMAELERRTAASTLRGLLDPAWAVLAAESEIRAEAVAALAGP
jgi:adenylate cyclase